MCGESGRITLSSGPVVNGVEVRHSRRERSLDDAGFLGDMILPVLSYLQVDSSGVIFGYLDALVEVAVLFSHPLEKRGVCFKGVFVGSRSRLA